MSQLSSTGSLTATPVLARKPWILPIIAAAIVACVGYWAMTNVEREMKGSLGEELRTILNADTEALKIWIENQRTIVRVLAREHEVREGVEKLIQLSKEVGIDKQALSTSVALSELGSYLDPIDKEYGYAGFIITNLEGWHIGAQNTDMIGLRIPENREALKNREALIERIIQEGTFFGKPFYKQSPDGYTAPKVRLFVSTVIHNNKGEAVALLSFFIRPYQDFTRILGIASYRESGETYAFDKDGTMLSQSRFEDKLKDLGLLNDSPDVGSMLRLMLRDPGGDLTQGFWPPGPWRDLPLTLMAEEATVNRQDGLSTVPYRDYRGVPVVGAWRWLPEYEFGVATEVDAAEAFRPLNILRLSFWVLIGLLILGALVLSAASWAMAHVSRRMWHAEKQAKQLGQYKLVKKIGAGGMGEVYLAEHALLKRPTAVKLLNAEKVSEVGLKRFEREVQLTCRLTHPNTLTVFDYGRTHEGIFYYSMEYIDGLSLSELVAKEGAQPTGRVIHLLLQVCGSLAEAHRNGMIHRDIKLSNIMISEHGGVYDFAKVLDFGIAKQVEGEEDLTLTREGQVAGTPHFTSPEAIRHLKDIDGRSDLYSLGVSAYGLLTGTYLYHAGSSSEIHAYHLTKKPERPSERLGKALPEDLEAVVLKLLEKERDDRYQSADELAEALRACRDAETWTQDLAKSWWEEFRAKVEATRAKFKADKEETPIADKFQVSLKKKHSSKHKGGVRV